MNEYIREKAEINWAKMQATKTMLQDPILLQEQLKESEIQRMMADFSNQELIQLISSQKNEIEHHQEQERLLLAILDALPTAVFVKDIKDDFKFVLWNKKAEELLGVTAEECIGKSDYDFFQKSEADWFRQKDIETSQLTSILDIPEELIKTGDETIVLHTQKRAIRNKEGQPCFLIGIAAEITQQKAAEERLKRSEEQFRSITENSPDNIMLVDQDLKIRYINHTVPDLTVEEVIGMSAIDFVPIDYQKHAKEQYQLSFESGKSCVFETQYISQEDQTVHYYEVRTAPIFSNNEVSELLVVCSNITLRKSAEEELLASKNQLEALFEVSPDFMLKSRISDLMFVDINQRACAFYGYTKEEFQQLNLFDVEKNPPAKLFKDTIYKDLKIGEVVTVKGLHQKKDGTTFPALVRVCKIDEEYELAAITDISEQQEIATVLRESQELSRAKRKAEESERRLKEAQQIAHIGYWELDMITKEEVWSDELYRIFEVSPSDVMPSEKAFLSNLHPDDRNFAHNTYVEMTKTQSAYHISYRLLLSNGKLKYVEERCQSEFDEEGNPIRSIGTVQDITDEKIAEENLKKSIKEIQDLKYALDQSAMVLMLNEEKIVLSANLNYCQTSGFSEAELLGQSFKMADLDYHSKWFLDSLWTVVKNGDVWKGELKNKTKSGTFYWVDTSIIPLLDEQKRATQFIVIQKDITDKKQLQEELELANEAEFAQLYQLQKLHITEIKEQSRELDRFFNLSMDMICVVTFEGYVKRVNPAFLKVLGYSEEELMSKPLYDLIHPNDLEDTLKNVQLMTQGKDLMSFENRYRTINGDYRLFSWRVVLDLESKLCYAISRDITEEKIASQKIEDLTLTLNQTAIVMVVGRDEKIISVNDKFCETAGYSKEEIIGQHHEILDSFYHSVDFWKELRATIESGQIWQGEIKERAKDGSFYWTYTSSVPFLDENGDVFQYIVIQSNITTQKKLEEDLREAKEEAIKNAKIKEDFLANMSHEIRTPMSGVLGFSRLLLQTNMDETQENYAQLIYSCAENLLVVVNDILDVSKIESGKFQLDEIEFVLEKMINDTINILKISIQQKELNLVINIDENIPKQLLASPNRIAQILINLIGNAIKFTKQGVIQLDVRLLETNFLLFEVKDTGIGIPEDKLEAIFESFTQAENYTTREHGGTGLGLSICKKLASLMGGEIGVRSTLGVGSVFYFTIPFKASTDNKEMVHLAQPKFVIERNNVPTVHVLVVEDNLVNQELASIYLNMLQCQVTLANNGEEALDKLAQQAFDLVLMDIQMPKKDGITTTQEIRQEDQKTPIIAMTAHALSKEKQKCFEIGMNDYIAKPFKIEELQDIILKYTHGKIKLYEKTNTSINNNLELSSTIENSFAANFAHLVHVMDGNLDLAQELLVIFKGELIKFTQNMELAFEENNIAIIKKHVHKIKPNFELLQLTDLYHISDDIYKLVVENDSLEKVKLLYQKIETEIPLLLKGIEEELS